MQNGHVIYCTGMWLRAYWLSTRKWITASERINGGQATHYKRATIRTDWATSSVTVSPFELVPVQIWIKNWKIPVQKKKTDVISTAVLALLNCMAWINTAISLYRDLEVKHTHMCSVFAKHLNFSLQWITVFPTKPSQHDGKHYWSYRYEITIILPRICIALDKEQSRLTYILFQWTVRWQNLRAKNLMGTATCLMDFRKGEKVKKLETLP